MEKIKREKIRKMKLSDFRKFQIYRKKLKRIQKKIYNKYKLVAQQKCENILIIEDNNNNG